MTGDNMNRAGLRALAKVHRNPEVSEATFRKWVTEMAVAHLDERVIRLFIKKAVVK